VSSVSIKKKTMNESDNQSQNNRPWLWKKGQSGNLMGRPKGKTMKEYARQYLERMTDEERDEWLEGMGKDKIWEMAEGKAKQDIEANVSGINIQVVKYGENNNDTPRIQTP
jgi:hypothetical protein